MTYEERRAPAGLAGIVSRAWFIEAPRLQRFEKILPLPFAHVIVNLSTPYRLFSPSGGSVVVSDAFVSGLQSEYLVIESPKLIRHVGLELTPGGLHALTPSAASASAGSAGSAGRVQDARALLDGIDLLVDRLRACSTPSEAIDVMIGWAIKARIRDADPLVAAALAAIDADPDLTMSLLADELGVSHRTLITRFRTATGTTPKRHAQVLRFHRFVDVLPTAGVAPDWAGLAAGSGYYDQPHVIRAFKRFSGWTPAEYHRLVSEYGQEAAHFVPLEHLPAQARS